MKIARKYLTRCGGRIGGEAAQGRGQGWWGRRG